MTQGFASDFDGSETVMDEPEATLTLDLSDMPAQQALALIQAAERTEEYCPYEIGLAAQGDDATFGDLEFHFSFGEALTLLNECGALDVPQQPDETPSPNDIEEVSDV